MLYFPSMKANKTHRVTVALRMAGIAGQDKLNGIFNYLSEGHRWQLSIFRSHHEFTAEAVHSEIRRGSEGFIVGIPGTDDALAVLARTDIPTIVMNVTGGSIEKRKRRIVFVKSDSSAVGKTAARELLKQGVYKCFGYAGYRADEEWSRDRGRSFRDELENAGFIGRMFDLAHYSHKIEDGRELIKWLKSLPKPCAILASCDDRAFELVDACKEAGLRIPGDVGILGINNDPLLCENSEPRISSVQPDFIREGRLAAEILGKMLDNPKFARQQTGSCHLVGVRQVVLRDSTRPLSQAGLLVQKALAYIDKNALRDIGVQDVAKHLRISYSLLNLRFQELQRESVYEAILRKRLDAVTTMLKTTDDTLDAIAEHCGWNIPSSLKKIFRKRMGMSMREFRMQNKPISS